ncbi:hypothetical protein B0H94_11640 [Salsuginibacillus halophilus]|uniref:Uncharacterized protein n=1 Tax=Salsuginibacillus halophilus TaxID=517424 RepID=A0A2P8H7Z0_9BACI|nr:hypothetical protein [Salsuginibacillus halophilus]PSL42336.1 hypothetical protein B0H94_11640 [Salsuginibacillus halophilus]
MSWNNKLVVLLPLLLMVILFAGGWFYIQQADTITNEDLSNHVQLEVEKTETSPYVVEAEWSWSETPEDGLAGDDYIGVSLKDEEGEPLSGEVLEQAELTLDHAGETVYETEGEVLDTGIIFSFPNATEENEVYGSSGKMTVTTEEETTETVISYLHTWAEHEGLDKQDPRFFDPAFLGNDNIEDAYWVIDRFVEPGDDLSGQDAVDEGQGQTPIEGGS